MKPVPPEAAAAVAAVAAVGAEAPVIVVAMPEPRARCLPIWRC